jgi:hypothetical protein
MLSKIKKILRHIKFWNFDEISTYAARSSEKKMDHPDSVIDRATIVRETTKERLSYHRIQPLPWASAQGGCAGRKTVDPRSMRA